MVDRKWIAHLVFFAIFLFPLTAMARNADIYSWTNYQQEFSSYVEVFQQGSYALDPSIIHVTLPKSAISDRKSLTFVVQIISKTNCEENPGFGCFTPFLQINSSLFNKNKYTIPVNSYPAVQQVEMQIKSSDLREGKNEIKAAFKWKGNLHCGDTRCGYVIQSISIKDTYSRIANFPAATPRPEPTATQTNYMITITSNPSGADLFIENKYRGKTPLRLSLLKNRNYTLDLFKAGYEQYHSRRLLTDTQMHIDLSPLLEPTPTLTPIPTTTPAPIPATIPTIVPQKRLALVIGNAAYPSAPLENPENDARAVTSALQRLGFEVIAHSNLTQKEMKRTIDRFGKRLRSYNVGLFFYSGHGIQAEGQNYLVPIDTEPESENDVEYDCVKADRVLAKMEDANCQTNIMLLDACRNNPFERSWTRSPAGKGLAVISAPPGSFISYATAPGTVAFDGEPGKSHSPYTEALLNHIETPNISIGELFVRVRNTVRQTTEAKQNPWESTSLMGNFYFNKQ